MTLPLLALLTLSLPVHGRPDEVIVEGRSKNNTFEVRVRHGQWTTKIPDLLREVKALGAGAETSILLDIEASVDAKSVVDLMDAFRKENFKKIEFASPLVPFEDNPPGKAVPWLVPDLRGPPAKVAPPLMIEVLHASPDCPLLTKGPVCATGPHWSFRVGGMDCGDADALRKALRKEAGAGPDPTGLGSLRPVTIRVAAAAPFGLLTELLVAVAGAGFSTIGFDADPAAPPGPDPGKDPLLAKAHDKSPLDVNLGVRLNDGAVEMKIDQGPWLTSEKAWMDQLRALKPTEQTRMRFEAAADLPWSAVGRLRRHLERWGFTEFAVLPAKFSLEGPIETTGVAIPDAADLGRDIEQGFKDGNLAVYERAFCLNELVRRTIGTTTLSIPMRLLFQRLADQFVPSREDVRQGKGEPPVLHFLFIRIVDGAPRPVFRQLVSNRLDYLEFVLGKNTAGQLRIIDVFSRATGELVSETLRANYLGDPGTLEVMNMLRAPTPGDLASGMGPGSEMMVRLFDGKAREALKYYEENAPALRKSKPAHRLRINIAATVGVDEFVKAIDDFERDLPGDLSLPFLRIQRCLAKKDLQRGLQAIDEFEQIIKMDVYLDVLRAQVHLAAADFPNARRLAEKAAEVEPTLDRAWWTAITACLGQMDFAATAKLLTATEKALGITLGDLSRVPAYAEFLKSPEYEEWRKARR